MYLHQSLRMTYKSVRKKHNDYVVKRSKESVTERRQFFGIVSLVLDRLFCPKLVESEGQNQDHYETKKKCFGRNTFVLMYIP